MDSPEIAINIMKGIPAELQNLIFKFLIFINMTVPEMICLIHTNRTLDKVIIEGLRNCQFDFFVEYQTILFLDTDSYKSKRYISSFNLCSSLSSNSCRDSVRLAEFMMKNNVKSLKANIDSVDLGNNLQLREFLSHCFVEVELIDPSTSEGDTILSLCDSINFGTQTFGSFFFRLPKLYKVSITININNTSWITPEFKVWCGTPHMENKRKCIFITITDCEYYEYNKYCEEASRILKLLKNYQISIKFNYQNFRINNNTFIENNGQNDSGVMYLNTGIVNLPSIHESVSGLNSISNNDQLNLDFFNEFENVLHLNLKNCIIPASFENFSKSLLSLELSFCSFVDSKFTIPKNIYKCSFVTNTTKFPEITNFQKLENVLELRLTFRNSNNDYSRDNTSINQIQQFIGRFDLLCNSLNLTLSFSGGLNYLEKLDLRRFKNIKWLNMYGYSRLGSYDFDNLPSELKYLDFNVEDFENFQNQLPSGLEILKINLSTYGLHNSLVNFQEKNLVSSVKWLEIAMIRPSNIDLTRFHFENLIRFHLIFEKLDDGVNNVSNRIGSIREDYNVYEEYLSNRISATTINLPENISKAFFVQDIGFQKEIDCPYVISGLSIKKNIERIEWAGPKYPGSLRIEDDSKKLLFCQ